MRLDISMEKLFPVPVERVWHALTDSQMINRWLMATDDFEARVGARFTLRDEPQPGFRGYVECQVLELSPPHRMVWSWSSTEGAAPTRLVIELAPLGSPTRAVCPRKLCPALCPRLGNYDPSQPDLARPNRP
jgi:uncharacterized protein YndB with AHSA1/START domain